MRTEAMGRLSGRVAIITGGGSGIGRATAVLFAAEGARVLIAGRRPEPLLETAAAARGVLPIAADVSRPEEVDRIIECCQRELGTPQILVNNAGLFEARGLLHETTVEAFDESMAINLRGPFLMTRAVIPHMLRAGGGSIVNVGSNLAQFAIPHAAAYCTAKGGLLMLTRATAVDYAPQGIRCNMVSPGLVRTEMTAAVWTSPGLAAEVAKEYPMGRFGDPGEIARAILHLASDESAWTTGAVLNVDGGASAR